MITIGMNYEVLEGKEHPFEAVFSSVLELMKGIEGHEKSALFKDVFNPGAYLIISEWSEERAFASFTASDKFKKITDWGKERILANRPRHVVYRDSEASLMSGNCPVLHASR